MTWLGIAAAIMWLGLAVYLCFLHGRQRALDARLRRLERNHD